MGLSVSSVSSCEAANRALWRRPGVWLVMIGLFACLQYRLPFPSAVLTVMLCRIVWQREKEQP